MIRRNYLKLKNNLKTFRLDRGLSQTDLANIVGSSRNTINSIENGKFCPSSYLAALLCVALDCTFEDLFYFVLEANCNEKTV